MTLKACFYFIFYFKYTSFLLKLKKKPPLFLILKLKLFLTKIELKTFVVRF